MNAIGQEKRHSSWQKQTHTLTREQSKRLARNIARRLVVACYTKHKVQKHTGTCLPQVSGRRVVVGWKRERTEKTWRVCINTEVVGSGAPGPLIYHFSSTCTSMEIWGRQQHTYMYIHIGPAATGSYSGASPFNEVEFGGHTVFLCCLQGYTFVPTRVISQ